MPQGLSRYGRDGRQQLEHADLLVLNKTDLVTPAQLREVGVVAAAATRREARQLHCQRGKVAPELLPVWSRAVHF